MLSSPSEWIPVDKAAEKLAAQSDEFSSADARHFLWQAFWQGEFDAPDGNPRDWGTIHTDNHLLFSEPTLLCRQWALIDMLALWQVLQLWDGGDTEDGRPLRPPEDTYPELYQRLATSFINMIDDGIGKDPCIDSISTEVIARSVVRREALNAWMNRNAFAMADGLHGGLDREAEIQARIVEHTKIEQRRAAKAEHDWREYERLRLEGQKTDIAAKLEAIVEDGWKRDAELKRLHRAAEERACQEEANRKAEAERLPTAYDEAVATMIIHSRDSNEETPTQRKNRIAKALADWAPIYMTTEREAGRDVTESDFKSAANAKFGNVTRDLVRAEHAKHGKLKRGEKANRQTKSPEM